MPDPLQAQLPPVEAETADPGVFAVPRARPEPTPAEQDAAYTSTMQWLQERYQDSVMFNAVSTPASGMVGYILRPRKQYRLSERANYERHLFVTARAENGRQPKLGHDVAMRFYDNTIEPGQTPLAFADFLTHDVEYGEGMHEADPRTGWVDLWRDRPSTLGISPRDAVTFVHQLSEARLHDQIRNVDLFLPLPGRSVRLSELLQSVRKRYARLHVISSPAVRVGH